ncbi:hypothetical protein SZ64_01955 [Erythrobacter sp. SG61-1L]|nr:hypothetical protein SZ64_01955 [Erythrobacter sp. SG61-1L]
MIRARLRGAGPERDACIVNLSTRGLAASAEGAPQRGEIVELVVGRSNLVGQVKWTSPRRFGIAFRDRISVVSLISGEGDLQLERATRSRVQIDARAANENGRGRGRVEFLLIAAAAALGTFYIADFATSALGSLQGVEQALGGSPVTSLAHVQ